MKFLLLSLVIFGLLSACGNKKTTINPAKSSHQDELNEGVGCSIRTLGHTASFNCETGEKYKTWEIVGIDSDEDPIWLESHTQVLVSSIKTTSLYFLKLESNCEKLEVPTHLKGKYGPFAPPMYDLAENLFYLGMNEIYPMYEKAIFTHYECNGGLVRTMSGTTGEYLSYLHPRADDAFGFCVSYPLEKFSVKKLEVDSFFGECKNYDFNVNLRHLKDMHAYKTQYRKNVRCPGGSETIIESTLTFKCEPPQNPRDQAIIYGLSNSVFQCQ